MNIRARPVVQVHIGREVDIYRAREPTAEEVGRYWPRLIKIWSAYQTHYDSSGQASLFVLELAETPTNLLTNDALDPASRITELKARAARIEQALYRGNGNKGPMPATALAEGLLRPESTRGIRRA